MGMASRLEEETRRELAELRDTLSRLEERLGRLGEIELETKESVQQSIREAHNLVRRLSIQIGSFEVSARGAAIDVVTVIASVVAFAGAAFSLWYAVSGLARLKGIFGFYLISPAYAATSSGQEIDPMALLFFHIVIALMVPVLTVGAFCAVIFAKTSDGRKSGRDILIGVMGFVLGTATRFV
jgi:hypothetical protein